MQEIKEVHMEENTELAMEEVTEVVMEVNHLVTVAALEKAIMYLRTLLPYIPLQYIPFLHTQLLRTLLPLTPILGTPPQYITLLHILLPRTPLRHIQLHPTPHPFLLTVDLPTKVKSNPGSTNVEDL